MTPSIPFVDLRAQRQRIETDLRRRMDAVLEHGQFVLGPEVAELERRIGHFAGVPHVQACANGTDALVLAMRALGVERGDRVVVPAFTFCATAEAVVLCGGIPVFADVDPRTFNVTAETVGEAIAVCDRASNTVTGVIAVDLFGQAPDYGALHELVADSPTWLLADAAQSFGGSYGDQRIGSLATVTTLSFFPAKPLGCYGDGGAVLTDDPDVAELLRSLHFHGKGDHQYDNVRIGYNSRLDSLQAAVLLAKLEVFEDELSRRQEVASRYSAALGDVATAPLVAEGAVSAWAQYTLLLAADRRDDVATRLRAQGIPVGVYYPIPIHHQTAYRDFHDDAVELPVSEQLVRCVLSLPMHPYLEEAVQERIIKAVRECL